MEEMREIVDIAVVETAVEIGAIVWFLACVLAGVAVGAARRTWAGSIVRALAVGGVGPLIGALWLLYSYMVRYDPETGYFGLDKVWVLAVNAVVFVLVGALSGYGLRWVWMRTAAPVAEAEPVGSANQSSQSKPASR